MGRLWIAVGVWVWLAAGVCAQQPAPVPPVGGIHGVVKDVDGVPVAGATVTAASVAGGVRKTTTVDDGSFEFTDFPAGPFNLTVVEDGLAPGKAAGKVSAGETVELAPFALPIATATFNVDAISQRDLAQLQIQQEEKQRLVGVLPNFFVSYDKNAVPLTAKQKFELTDKTILDPANFAFTMALAGIEQAQNTFPGYGSGPGAYGMRFGAAFADFVSGAMLGGAVLPVVFHQDPRYFYKGTGSVWRRTGYAIAMAAVSKGDNGKWQPAYAAILGDLASGAISNIYHPASSRDGAALTFENGGLSILFDAGGNIIQEFLLKHLTPKVPKQP
jgi:hypothetical protein